MIRRRAKVAGIAAEIGRHTFRATGITAYLANGGALEHAQEMAAHESPRTTKLYHRTKERLTQDAWKGSDMSGRTEQFEGGCLCGAVRFIATGQPKGVAWCHCQSCRKHSGAPVSVFVAFDRTAYTVTEGEITKFNSSPGRWRGFCARCGSTLTCEGEPSSTETHFHVGAFDQAARLQPTRHIFPEERLPWLHVGDA
jgi:hypothetical protein